MKRYIYKNKKTGKKTHSDKPINDNDLILVCENRNGMIKSADVLKK